MLGPGSCFLCSWKHCLAAPSALRAVLSVPRSNFASNVLAWSSPLACRNCNTYKSMRLFDALLHRIDPQRHFGAVLVRTLQRISSGCTLSPDEALAETFF